jgi:lipid-binding SYLF domain-containing protein
MLCLSVTTLVKADQAAQNERIQAAADVLKQLSDASSGLPRGLLNQSACVIILPSVKKAAFIVGAQYGRGVMVCRKGRNFNGKWSAPVMMQSTGGSFGLQAGGQATDFVLLVLNDKGAQNILNGKVKLGAEASVAAGPVGRNAEAATNGGMNAQILSYSRANGVFAGASLSGTSLGPSGSDNKELYDKEVTGPGIVAGVAVKPPDSAKDLEDLITKLSPSRKS